MDETFTEISKAFRNVTRVLREKTEDYFGKLSPLERSLREVNDDCSCTIQNSLIRDIAKAANDPSCYPTIMQCVWEGLTAQPWQWRRIYKALLLLENLLLLGPAHVETDCAGAATVLRSLREFRYFEGPREEGGGVRQRAICISELLASAEKMEEAKEQLASENQRYKGIENPLSNLNGRLPPMSGFGVGRPDVAAGGRHVPPNPFLTGGGTRSWGDLGGAWALKSEVGGGGGAYDSREAAYDAPSVSGRKSARRPQNSKTSSMLVVKKEEDNNFRTDLNPFGSTGVEFTTNDEEVEKVWPTATTTNESCEKKASAGPLDSLFNVEETRSAEGCLLESPVPSSVQPTSPSVAKSLQLSLLDDA